MADTEGATGVAFTVTEIVPAVLEQVVTVWVAITEYVPPPAVVIPAMVGF